MVDNRRYKRYFIILENEDTGFEKEEKKIPKGYAKIEIRNGKGVLNVYVQDLKYFKDGKYIYRNYLISTKAKICIDTGSFMIDEKGKGELKWKLDPSDINGTGKDIEEFNVVAIVAESMEKRTNDEKVVAPLVGYIDKEKVEWKSVLRDKGHYKMQEEYKEEPEEEEELDEKYKEKYEKIMKVIEEGSKEFYGQKIEEDEEKHMEDIEDEEEKQKEQYEEVKEEIDNKEQEKVENKEQEEKHMKNEEAEEIEKDNNEKIQEEVKEKEIPNQKTKDIEEKQEKEVEDQYKEKNKEKGKEDVKDSKKQTKHELKYEPYMKGSHGEGRYFYYKKHHKMVYKYIRDILKYYEVIQPFEKNIGKCKWWKIEYDNQSIYRGFLPFFGYILNIYYYNPYISYMNNCNNLMHKYGHYIFGICYDKDNEPKYYIYGVPGRYMYKEQPFRGMTGFVYWHPLEDKKPEKGDYGYWLLHIDARTGNIVFPLKPTIPPMY